MDAYYRIPLSADGIVRANSFGIMPDDKKALLFSSLEKHKAVFGRLLSTSLDDEELSVACQNSSFVDGLLTLSRQSDNTVELGIF